MKSFSFPLVSFSILLWCSIVLFTVQGWVPLSQHYLTFRRQQYKQKRSNQNTVLDMGAKFAQPAFSQDNNQRKNNNKINKRKKQPDNQQLQDKQKVQDKVHVYQSDSRLMDLHQQRVQTAGRVGTKRFVNPCLVYIGNLPFNTTSTQLQTWLCEQMATPASLLLHQNVQIIQDWKTGQSKGYAFVTFAAAHFATIAIDRLHQTEYQGRLLTVAQGKKKPDPNLIFMMEQKRLKKLQRSTNNTTTTSTSTGSLEEETKEIALEILEPEEYALLARLDPDLLVNTKLDESLLNEDNDDYDEDEYDTYDEYDGYDGTHIDMNGNENDIKNRHGNKNEIELSKGMNRQQRREAAKSKKRKKLPHKGFG